MYTSIFVVALGAACALAAPSHLAARGSNTTSSGGVNDTQILQFALNLELLENTFYAQGLNTFNASAFQSAGFAPAVRDRYVQIQQHEATHVQLLQSILGADAPQACNYSFPITDVASFVSISLSLESAGESAYLGAASLIQNKTILSTAASILAVEGRQATWISNAVLGETPWNGPFDTPLNTSAVWSLASSFIVACPSTNPPLPVIPLNILTLTPGNATIGQNVTVQVSGQDDFLSSNIPITNTSFVASPAPSLPGKFVAYFHGGSAVSYSLINSDNTTTIPSDIAGIAYASVVSTNATAPSQGDTLSGLAVINIPVAANASNASD